MSYERDARFPDEEVCLWCAKLHEDHLCCERCNELFCEGTGEVENNGDTEWCSQSCYLASIGL